MTRQPTFFRDGFSEAMNNPIPATAESQE